MSSYKSIHPRNTPDTITKRQDEGLIETCIVYMVSEVEPKGPSITILGAITKDEQVLSAIDIAGLKYKYLVLDNATIHKTLYIKDWIPQRGYEIIYLPALSPFLNPMVEEFWSKLKGVVNKDPAS
ncbi:hypothetical protein CU098_006609, partial [Rhizopus stolonifer]